MPYPGLLHSESLFLWQSTADPYLLRTHPKTVLSQSPCGSRSWCAQGTFEPSECLWKVWGLILNVIVSLVPSFWGFFFAPGHGVSPQSHLSVMQLLLQHMIETSVSQFSHSVVSDSLQPHGLQHTRPSCTSPTPGVYSNSCPLSQ